MKKYPFAAYAAAVAVVLAAAFPAMSFAASMTAGPVASVQGTTAAQGNAYAAGGTVTAGGTVNGDLLAAGGTVFSSAKVDGDLMLAGGTVTAVGGTAQDARIAGGNVTVGEKLNGELVALGSSIMVTPDTTIAKDSYLTGGVVIFDGNEAGNLKIAASGAVTIDGTVNGNLTISRAASVTIGPDAAIKGTLEYSAPTAAAIDANAKISGTPAFHQIQAKNDGGSRGFWPAIVALFTIWWLIKILMVLTAAYFVWYLFRSDSIAGLEQSRAHYGRSLWHGFAFAVLVPVAVIIVCITVIGVIPGVIALLAYAAILILASPFAALFASSLIFKGTTALRWHYILAGVVAFAIVGLIPFIGWIACALIYLPALGALTDGIKGKFARK